MKILVVEAAAIMARAVVATLRSRGHTVDWVVGYSKLEPLVCVKNNGHKLAIEDGQYDLVFLDVNLKKNEQKGIDLVPALKGMNVPIYAIGAMPAGNQELVEAGVTGAIPKTTFLLTVVHDEVSLEDLLDFTKDVSDKLDAVSARASSDDAYRKAGEAAILKHM